MKEYLQVVRQYVVRFVFLFILHISLNWLWGESEDIVSSILHALLLTGVLYLNDHFSRKKEEVIQ